MKLLTMIATVGFSFFASNLNAAEDIVFRAMDDELQRSMKLLQFGEFDKPYYLSYRLVDSHTRYIAASLGAILSETEQLQRQLVVDLRIGNYQLDSSNLFELNFSRVPSLLKYNSIISLPIEADYTEIRRQLWLATDAAYKAAVQRLAKKKALLAGKNNTDRPDDFLKVQAYRKIEPDHTSSSAGRDMSLLLQKLSVIGNLYPEVQLSELDWRFTTSYTRFIDSEGSKIGRNDAANRILFRAEAQSDDGESLFEEEVIFAANPDKLPNNKLLTQMIDSRYQALSQRRNTAVIETYVGPVLLKPPAAAELLRQTIGKQIIAYRKPETNNSMRIQGFAVNTLQGQINQRILPRGFTLTDQPLSTEFKGESLLGNYWADDQGVEPQNQVLIKNGRLVQLISKRSPVPEVEVRGGNYLDGNIVVSNLVLQSKQTMTTPELEQELLILAEETGKDYGIVIERLDGEFKRLNSPRMTIFFGNNTGLTLDGLSAYKLYKDGRKELIRQLQLPRFDIRSLKDIVAAGDDAQVYHAPALTTGGSFFFNAADTVKYNISSYVSPSLLFEELSIVPQENARQSIPVGNNPISNE